MLSKAVKYLSLGLFSIWLTGCASGGGEPVESPADVPRLRDDSVPLLTDDATSSPGFSQLRQSTLYFDFASNRLRPAELARIGELSEFLTSSAGKAYRVHIVGHTDVRGTKTYNVGLGDRRAKAVAAQLGKMGVPSTRVETLSMGAAEPADEGLTAEAHRMNRRAIVSLREYAKLITD